MESFEGLQVGEKLIDKTDGMIVEFKAASTGISYLSNRKEFWPTYQFKPEEFEKYDGPLEVGEFEEIKGE